MNNIEFNLSNPINKFWYSKCKKYLIKGNYKLKAVLNDAKNKNIVKYSPRYYAFAKFIKYTTNLKFIKKQNYKYYIMTFNDDFIDVVTTDDKTKLCCINQSNDLTRSFTTKYRGKKIGKCRNNCCDYYSYRENFDIQWI